MDLGKKIEEIRKRQHEKNPEMYKLTMYSEYLEFKDYKRIIKNK